MADAVPEERPSNRRMFVTRMADKPFAVASWDFPGLELGLKLNRLLQ